jgi:serine/threonine protein kinase
MTDTVYYCDDGSFDCNKQCKYNSGITLDAGANGKVFSCNNSAHVLKEDTTHDRTDKINTQKSLALQGEFNFISWAIGDEKDKYKNVAKMHRVKCADNTKEETKCETIATQPNEIKLDKTKVVIEKIIPLKSYVERFIETKCTAKAEKVCKQQGQEGKYDNVLSVVTMGFKMTLIDKLKDAINDLHELGYCHNDLKPGNIGVSGNNQIKFIDMGTAVPITKEHKDKYYNIKETDLSFGHTVIYDAPMFLQWITHDIHRDNWAIGCVIYDIVNDFEEELFYDQNVHSAAKTLMTTNKGTLRDRIDEKLNAIVQKNNGFTENHKTTILEQMMALMEPTLHESLTMFDTVKVVNGDLVYTEEETVSQQTTPVALPLEKPKPKLNRFVVVEESSEVNTQPIKKGRFQICNGGGSGGSSKPKKAGANSNACSSKIIPGIQTDQDGEYMYITDPQAYKQYLIRKFPKPPPQPNSQGGGKKKHNTGKLITKERYDKEKKKLSKNVSHVRKYNTSKGFVYYLFKKS